MTDPIYLLFFAVYIEKIYIYSLIFIRKYMKLFSFIHSGSTVKFRVFMNLYSSSYYIGEAEQELLPVLDQHWRTGLAESGFLLDTIEVRSTGTQDFHSF